MTIDEMIKVLEGARDGKKVESRARGHAEEAWVDVERPLWDFYFNEYRIKPEPREWWLCKVDNDRWIARHSPDAGTIHVREVLE
jgi:hypothetical protein